MTCSPYPFIPSKEPHSWFVLFILSQECNPDVRWQASLDSALFHPTLRADPLSRCAALSLPKDSIAILPFYQTQAELDLVEQDQTLARWSAPSSMLSYLMHRQGCAVLTEFYPGLCHRC